MYRPTDDNTTTANNKLPVLVYFHGGSFCLCSFELPHFHAGALRLAAELPTLVLSTDYRLALEHRLPTTSRPGNIAHHVAIQYGSGQLALDPVIWIAGCVLLWPFFAAEERMASEAAGLVDNGMTLFDEHEHIMEWPCCPRRGRRPRELTSRLRRRARWRAHRCEVGW
ncbi:carboxylesterase 15-like [Miscanthus floridulus]|uniref:carboxylesterase 15-like n=1 Tax=Miscanthus floridulus TaxID=154761 RepID=UPI00345983C6